MEITQVLVIYVSIEMLLSVWGAKIQNQRLPYQFHEMFDRFISAYTKEYAQATSEGKTDKNSCDPIPFKVYKLILKWAIETSNILVWFLSLSQWNCMARSANIDPLKFHNFSVACFVHHSNSILANITHIPGHKINNIPLLHDTKSDLLKKTEGISNDRTNRRCYD